MGELQNVKHHVGAYNTLNTKEQLENIVMNNIGNINQTDRFALHSLQSVFLLNVHLQERIRLVTGLLEAKAQYSGVSTTIEAYCANTCYKSPLHMALNRGECVLIPLFLAFGEDYLNESLIEFTSDGELQCKCNIHCKSLETYHQKSRLENAIYVGNYTAVLYALQDSSTQFKRVVCRYKKR